VCRWKKFENRSIIYEDREKSKVPFLAHPLYSVICREQIRGIKWHRLGWVFTFIKSDRILFGFWTTLNWRHNGTQCCVLGADRIFARAALPHLVLETFFCTFVISSRLACRHLRSNKNAVLSQGHRAMPNPLCRDDCSLRIRQAADVGALRKSHYSCNYFFANNPTTMRPLCTNTDRRTTYDSNISLRFALSHMPRIV